MALGCIARAETDTITIDPHELEEARFKSLCNYDDDDDEVSLCEEVPSRLVSFF